MAGRAATALAVGWMSLFGGLAAVTMDHSLGRGHLTDWVSGIMSSRSSVHYKTSNAPFLMIRPKIAGRIEGEAAAAAPVRSRAYWI
jgi:hypothetical protein